MPELFEERVHVAPSAFSAKKPRPALWSLIWLNVILVLAHKAALIASAGDVRFGSKANIIPGTGSSDQVFA
jgi:hypothetical protein